METTKKTKEMDMLNGGLAGKLILFSIPLAFSSILQQLFNSVDVAVVGHFANSQAQAAVGCNGPVINMVIQFGGCSCSWKICRRQGISSSRKLCSVSRYFCKPDRGIFRRSECSVSKPDRTEAKR